MKRLTLLACVLLAGCFAHVTPQNGPVIAEETKVVNIDQELLRDCDDPDQMPGAMSEDDALGFSMEQASKLKTCKQRHHALVIDTCKALNCTPPK